MPSYLQGNVYVIFDVFDNVAFNSWVTTGLQHVSETRRPIQVNTLGRSGTKQKFLMTLELTGKNCTWLQSQTYQCWAGTPSDLLFSVDEQEKCKSGKLSTLNKKFQHLINAKEEKVTSIKVDTILKYSYSFTNFYRLTKSCLGHIVMTFTKFWKQMVKSITESEQNKPSQRSKNSGVYE